MKLKIAGEWKQPFNIRKKKWPYVPTKLKVLVRPPTSSEPPCFWSLLLNLFHLLELGDLFLYGSRTSSVGATGTHVGIGVGVGGDGLKYGAVCDIKGIGPGSGIFGNSSKGRPTWKLAFKTRVSVKSTVKNSLNKLKGRQIDCQNFSLLSKGPSIVKKKSAQQRYRDANLKWLITNWWTPPMEAALPRKCSVRLSST